jgi:hypothetical protein
MPTKGSSFGLNTDLPPCDMLAPEQLQLLINYRVMRLGRAVLKNQQERDIEMSRKKTIAIVLTICVAATSFAQEIKGIGDFKIGMSIEDFLELPFVKENNIQDKASRRFGADEKDAGKASIESQVKKHNRPHTADIVQYEFAAPMGIHETYTKDSYNTTAEFYNGKLAVVYVSNATSEFEVLLTAKYGQPTKENKLKRVYCQNAYGANLPSLGGTESVIWGKGKKITATIGNLFYDCGKVNISYTVADETVANILKKIKRDAAKIEDKAIEAARAKAMIGITKF